MSNAIGTRHNREDLLTRLECEQILSKVLGTTNAGKLLEFHVVPELGTIGYLGEYYHLLLSYQLDNDKSIKNIRLFVKSNPYVSGELIQIIKKEVAIYETLLNELRTFSQTIWCAQCYLAKKDLFVMQNIVDLGYEPLQDPGGFLTESQIIVILKGLATLHASSIAFELRNKVNIGDQLQDMLFEATVAPTIGWYTTGLRAVQAVIAAHPKYQSEKMQEFISNQLPAKFNSVYEMVNQSRKYRNVFCHRDPWGGNIFFSKTQPNDVATVFVDFQLCRYSPPAIDVLLATYLNIKPIARKKLMPQFCLSYYNEFFAELTAMGYDANAQISLNGFKQSITEFELFGALYNCIAATILRVPGDYLQKMKQNQPEEFRRYTGTDRTKEVLQLINTNTDFRDYMFECIEDLMAIVLPTLTEN